MTKYEHLFQPLKVGKSEIKNRIFMPPISTNLADMRRRIDNILLGYTFDDKPFMVKDLGVTGAILVLLKTAFKPNLVQTTEGTPAFIHGGPFANIAHGCNSIVATKTAMTFGEYVITEAGFGADLGAEKFFNIKCRKHYRVRTVACRVNSHNENCKKVFATV